ncbi:hypothetical protein O3P69_007118 [Scylla paramamosain]|uniref:Uncharacterized protein n=1 Tax=Scylla paramamosain TaxID=85552 RepID=A0AAW0V2U0_SCYPA
MGGKEKIVRWTQVRTPPSASHVVGRSGGCYLKEEEEEEKEEGWGMGNPTSLLGSGEPSAHYYELRVRFVAATEALIERQVA